MHYTIFHEILINMVQWGCSDTQNTPLGCLININTFKRIQRKKKNILRVLTISMESGYTV